MSIKKVGPFDGLEVLEKGETITNPFSGESVFLEPDAVALYDLIKGFEVLGDYKNMQKALAHFSENWPDEYFTLLD